MEEMNNQQLFQLSKPFPSSFIGKKQGLDYVEHSVINQALLSNIGPFTFEWVQDIYDGEELTGVYARLTATIDGQEVSVVEAGDATNPQAKTNGQRSKTAMSDALKRCAMRVGCGLHLWAGDNYRLYDVLEKRMGVEASTEDRAAAIVAEQEAVEEPAPKKKTVKKAAKKTTAKKASKKTAAKKEEPVVGEEPQPEPEPEVAAASTSKEMFSQLREIFTQIPDDEERDRTKTDFKEQYKIKYGQDLSPATFGEQPQEWAWAKGVATAMMEARKQVQSVSDDEQESNGE